MGKNVEGYPINENTFYNWSRGYKKFMLNLGETKIYYAHKLFAFYHLLAR